MKLVRWVRRKRSIKCFNKVLGYDVDMNHRDVIKRIIKLDHYDVKHCKHNRPILSRKKDAIQKLGMIYNTDEEYNPNVNVATDFIFLKFVKYFVFRYNIYKQDFSDEAARNFSNIVINCENEAPLISRDMVNSMINKIFTE